METRYANAGLGQQQGMQQAIPREATHLERLLSEIDRLSSRAAELCGDVATHANKLSGEAPSPGPTDKAQVKAIGPGGILGEMFAKIDTISDYIEGAHSSMSRARRAV